MAQPKASPGTALETSRGASCAEQPATTADAWSEESSRQAQQLASAPAREPSLFGEFRRKLACGESLSRALERLADALQFSGRITLTFHQGKLTKTLLEESYYRGRPMQQG